MSRNVNQSCCSILFVYVLQELLRNLCAYVFNGQQSLLTCRNKQKRFHWDKVNHFNKLAFIKVITECKTKAKENRQSIIAPLLCKPLYWVFKFIQNDLLSTENTNIYRINDNFDNFGVHAERKFDVFIKINKHRLNWPKLRFNKNYNLPYSLYYLFSIFKRSQASMTSH